MSKEIDAAYKMIEDAIAGGKKVELCSINQKGQAVSWGTLGDRNVRDWHPNRYRIDGEEVWSDC